MKKFVIIKKHLYTQHRPFTHDHLIESKLNRIVSISWLRIWKGTFGGKVGANLEFAWNWLEFNIAHYKGDCA